MTMQSLITPTAKLAVVTGCLLCACTREENLGNTPRELYTTLATTPPHAAYDVRADATHVYWFVEDGGSFAFYRVPKTGGPTETVAVLLGGPMRRFSLEGDYIYALQNGAGNLVRVPKSGGAVETVVDVPNGDSWLLGVSDEWAYVMDSHPPDPYTLWRVAKSGGVREDFFTGVTPYGYEFQIGARGLAWMEGTGAIWFQPSDTGTATRVMETIGSGTGDTTPVAEALAMTGNNLFVVTHAREPYVGSDPAQFDAPIDVLRYDIGDRSVTDLGGVSAFPSSDLVGATADGLLMLEPHDYVTSGALTANYSLAFYSSDASGRKLIWDDVPFRGGVGDGPAFEPDGSAMFWIDSEAGRVNRFDIDLTSMLQ